MSVFLLSVFLSPHQDTTTTGMVTAHSWQWWTRLTVAGCGDEKKYFFIYCWYGGGTVLVMVDTYNWGRGRG